MNRITRTIFCCLALCVLFLSPVPERVFASSAGGNKPEKAVNKRQNDIAITCPAQVSYQIEAIPQWEAGFYGTKRLVFEDAAVSGRMLTCNYAAKNGSTRDSATLMREIPAGYVCKNDYHAGAKNWQFLCKRAVAPIKIKPKSD